MAWDGSEVEGGQNNWKPLDAFVRWVKGEHREVTPAAPWARRMAVEPVPQAVLLPSTLLRLQRPGCPWGLIHTHILIPRVWGACRPAYLTTSH